MDFPRYNKKCSGENEILRGIFHLVQYHVFLFISCYVAEIWITFWTVGYTDHLQYHYSATKESGLALSLSLSRNAVFVAHFMTGTDR